MNADFKLSQVY